MFLEKKMLSKKINKIIFPKIIHAEQQQQKIKVKTLTHN